MPDVIDKHVEVFEEVRAQNSPDAGIRLLELSEILNDGNGVRDGMLPGSDHVDIWIRGTGIGCNTGDPDVALSLEMRFGGKRRLEG